ncbi:MAG: hypothetical protein LLG01_11160 [Planctomycetaceae bacterium]|nr:hypothetical protein [Planctomycetaceae bacterium]
MLGLPGGCGDVERIEAAVRRQMDRLDAFALHPDTHKRQAVQEMMNRLATARGCLIDSRRRKAYDQSQGIRPGAAPPGPGLAKAPPSPTAASAGAAEQKPAAVIEAPLQISPRETLREFESRVKGHLQRWSLNPHEETLLMAEAALLGMDESKARAAIHRLGDAPVRRRRRSLRLKKWLLGVIAAETLVVLIMPTAREIVDKLNDYERIIRENPQLRDRAPAVIPAPPPTPAPAPAPAVPPRKRRR